MPRNAELAATYVRIHALGHSSGNRAHFVRVAVAAGGINLAITHFARDYGNNLLLAGFQVLATNPPLAGDVVVIQPIPGHPAGHMALYDGSVWISDFKQYHGFYPGPAYRQIKPPYKIYRHN